MASNFKSVLVNFTFLGFTFGFLGKWGGFVANPQPHPNLSSLVLAP